MKKNLGRILAVGLGVGLMTTHAAESRAQSSEVKEKPAMYTYVAFWGIPRAQWTDFEKQEAANQKFMEKGLSDDSLVGFGSDQNLIHSEQGPSHDAWFSSMSMAGLFNTLDQIYKSGSPTSPVMANAPRHWDDVFVSHYYNWHSGSFKDAYTYGSSYKLKPDSDSDTLDKLSKNLIVPILEKMLADGTIHEYEIDTEAIHTEAPGTFFIEYVATNAEGLDKVNAAVREALKTNPLSGPAFGAAVESSAHRDFLSRTTGAYK
jgi:hypothetical protein